MTTTSYSSDYAPTRGNRPVFGSWSGKSINDFDEDELLAMRDYITQEAGVLGFNHGKRKCPDALATNPFDTEFFLGHPHRYWNDVYLHAAEEGLCESEKRTCFAAPVQRPQDTLNRDEVFISLSVIEALKDIDHQYREARMHLDLNPSTRQLADWKASLLWFDFKESDLDLLTIYRSRNQNLVDDALTIHFEKPRVPDRTDQTPGP